MREQPSQYWTDSVPKWCFVRNGLRRSPRPWEDRDHPRAPPEDSLDLEVGAFEGGAESLVDVPSMMPLDLVELGERCRHSRHAHDHLSARLAQVTRALDRHEIAGVQQTFMTAAGEFQQKFGYVPFCCCPLLLPRSRIRRGTRRTETLGSRCSGISGVGACSRSNCGHREPWLPSSAADGRITASRGVSMNVSISRHGHPIFSVSLDLNNMTTTARRSNESS